MNVERIIELADLIETLPDDEFNMSHFLDPVCNTPWCIGGWAVWKYDRGAIARGRSIEYTALELLDLTIEQSDLFYPGCHGLSSDRISKHHAAATLRHLAETGEVKWTISKSTKL